MGAVFSAELLNIDNLTDDIFFQQQIGIADQVVQGDFQGLGDGGGHLDGRLDFVAFIAADDGSLGAELFS